MSELSPYIAAYLMPQLSYSGPQPTTSISNLSSCVSTPAVKYSTSSGTSHLYFSRRFISSSSSMVSPSSSHVCPISVLVHTFISSTLPFFIWSFAVRNFSTTSCHVVNVEASVFKWNPRTGLSGSSCTKVPSIKCSFHSASLDMTPHLLQAYLISDRSFLSNTTFDQTSGCSSPQHGHGAFHSPRLLFSYSTSILEAPLTVGVEMSTCFLFQNVV